MAGIIGALLALALGVAAESVNAAEHEGVSWSIVGTPVVRVTHHHKRITLRRFVNYIVREHVFVLGDHKAKYLEPFSALKNPDQFREWQEPGTGHERHIWKKR